MRTGFEAFFKPQMVCDYQILFPLKQINQQVQPKCITLTDIKFGLKLIRLVISEMQSIQS